MLATSTLKGNDAMPIMFTQGDKTRANSIYPINIPSQQRIDKQRIL